MRVNRSPESRSQQVRQVNKLNDFTDFADLNGPTENSTGLPADLRNIDNCKDFTSTLQRTS